MENHRCLQEWSRKKTLESYHELLLGLMVGQEEMVAAAHMVPQGQQILAAEQVEIPAIPFQEQLEVLALLLLDI